MKRYLTLLLFFPALAMAQSKQDTLRFEIIKATVNFLATDNKISSDLKFTVKCAYPNYSCLEVSIDEQKLSGVLPKVRVWDSKKKGNTAEDLAKLKERIWNDILKPEKAYRKTLPGFPAYSTLMKQDLKPASVTPAPVNTTEAIGPDQLVAEEATDTAKPILPLKPITTKTMEESYYPLIALAVSLLSILISLYAVFKKNTVAIQSFEPHNFDTDELKFKIKELQDELSRYQQGISKELDSLKISLENRITELENNKNTLELAVNNKIASAPITIPKLENYPAQDGRTYKYAKFSDLDAGGFSPGMLSDQQNGEQTYEIYISGNRAEYSVSDDTRAQKYALQNYEYLTDACEIKGQPQNNSTIQTLSKGELSKSAEGNWIIEKKAVIEIS